MTLVTSNSALNKLNRWLIETEAKMSVNDYEIDSKELFKVVKLVVEAISTENFHINTHANGGEPFAHKK